MLLVDTMDQATAAGDLSSSTRIAQLLTVPPSAPYRGRFGATKIKPRLSRSTSSLSLALSQQHKSIDDDVMRLMVLALLQVLKSLMASQDNTPTTPAATAPYPFLQFLSAIP